VPNPSARDDEAGCGKPFPEKSKNWIQGILQDTTIFHGNQGEPGFPVSIFHKNKSIDPTNLPTSLGYVLPLPGSILARTFFCRGPLIAPPHNIVSAPCRLPTGRVTCKAVGFAFCKEQGSKAGSSLQ